MSQYPKMVYKVPGKTLGNGGVTFDYEIAADEDAEQALIKVGFASTLQAAIDGDIPSDESGPTREELEAKATELGLKFDGRTSDRKLGALISEALGE